MSINCAPYVLPLLKGDRLGNLLAAVRALADADIHVRCLACPALVTCATIVDA